jgi:hypothetical protein
VSVWAEDLWIGLQLGYPKEFWRTANTSLIHHES